MPQIDLAGSGAGGRDGQRAGSLGATILVGSRYSNSPVRGVPPGPLYEAV